MFGFLRNINKLPKKFAKLLAKSEAEQEAFEYLQSTTPPGNDSDVILVQTVERFCYLALFGLIVKSVRKYKPIHVEQFVLNSVQANESASFASFLKSRFIAALTTRKWVKLYAAFCNDVAYKSAGISMPVSDVVDLFLACRYWLNLEKKDELLRLRIKGVYVGDLIYDTYMRFKPAPTVDLKDKYLIVVLWQALRDIRRAKKYFSEVKPKAYLTSYTTYIQHGVAVRVALMAGVRVFSLSNFQEFAKELSIEDWYQTQNPDCYANDFSRLDDKESKLVLAEKAMNARISGKIDSATSYMKKSAYLHSDKYDINLQDTVIVFLHDFYDSPHVYRNMVFSDFWEWACFTIETLQNNGVKFYIKPHPNQIKLSNKVLDDLQYRYLSLKVLSKDISNKQLVDAGMACGVTVYGTIANELAYMGVPTIAAARHPHVSFDFCKTATNKTDYASYLKNYSEFNLDQSVMRRQSLIFYYMHNLNFNEEQKKLMQYVIKLHCNYQDGDAFPSDLLNAITNSSALDSFAQKLAQFH